MDSTQGSSSSAPVTGENSKTTNKLIRADLRVHYEFGNNGKIKCKLCEKTYEQKYEPLRGWFNFERHLTLTHNIPKEKFTRANKTASQSENITRYYQQGLKRKYDNSNCYASTDTRQIKFEKDVLDLIAIDGHPLDVTSRMGFINLIKNQNSQLRIPSRRTIGRKLNQSMTQIRKENVDCISKAKTIHVSFDLWSSISRHSVLGVKAHFVDHEWKLQTWTIGFKHFTHRKSAHNLRLFLKHLFADELKIGPGKISTVMADNAAENVKAFDLEQFKHDAVTKYDSEDSSEDETNAESNTDSETCYFNQPEDDLLAASELLDIEEQDENILESELESPKDWTAADFTRLGCVAHALQLVLKEALNSNETTKFLIGIITDIVSFFHKSNTWSDKLYRKTKLHVVSIGKTRWNTVFLALQRLLKENFIDNVNETFLDAKSKGVSTPPSISSSTLNLLKELYELLDPIKELTDTLQGDGITSSMVLLGIICLNNALCTLQVSSDELKAFRNNFCTLLVERFASPLQHSYRGRGPRKQLLKVFEKKESFLEVLTLNKRKHD